MISLAVYKTIPPVRHVRDRCPTPYSVVSQIMTYMALTNSNSLLLYLETLEFWIGYLDMEYRIPYTIFDQLNYLGR